MGVVTFFVETTDGFLDNAAETQFGMVAATVGTLGTVTCTLVVLFVFLNLAFGFRDMDGRMTFWLVVKMVLIAIFAQSWTQFSTFSSALLNGIDSIAGALVASVGGGGEIGPSGTFAEEFDVLIGTMTEYLDAIADSMNWMTGAVINGIGLVLLSLLGGIAAFIVVFARVVMTLMLALAPIMIFLTLFDATKDYFLRWVSSTASFALYPVVVAGVFATIIGVGGSLMASLGDPATADNIGALVPFFMLILMSKAFILATPFLVRAISGNVVMPAMQAVSPDGARGFTAGVANTRGSQYRAKLGARSDTELAGAATRHIATGAGAQVQRIMQRNKRLM
ncbi:MAG: type IV secretion system protein [Limimaricola soesokkakensis]|uniref:type IV secretion system protein n=1 Tax=Limimaricola soesokkakensis TaxID=1343159 RepID=UPI00405A4B31